MMTSKPRNRRRPLCEALEGRALMAYTALDPSFGTGGVVLGAASGAGSAQQNAVAALPGGKVLVAESTYTYNSVTLDVARYNADGTLDATFGTGGRAAIPVPAGGSYLSTAPAEIAVLADGTIAVAATTENDNSNPNPLFQSFVVRLTADGAPDTAFGTAGVVLLPTATVRNVGLVTAGPDGGLVLAGVSVIGANGLGDDVVVVRLTGTGALDTTFNETGSVSLTVPQAPGLGGLQASVTGLAVDSAGRVVLCGTNELYHIPYPVYYTAFVARVTAAGAPDATFGTGGVVSHPGQNTALAVQGDDKIVVAGNDLATFVLGSSPGRVTLTRLNVDGVTDTSFGGLGPILSGKAGQSSSFNSLAIGTDGVITAAGGAGFGYPYAGSVLVARYRADGTPDAGFGIGGLDRVPIQSPDSALLSKVETSTARNVAVTATNQILLVGTAGTRGLLARLLPVAVTPLADDYDLDGRSDVAAQLTSTALFAIRPSGGQADLLQTFGAAGAGNTIPAPGDYDGDGVADVAAYLPQYGILAYRSSAGNGDTLVTFGSAGAGASIPAPGDYDGDGKTDVAVYLPAYGALAVRPSNGGANYLVPFGPAGAGNAVPVPGDYDGDGKTDVAVYMPAYGALAVHPSGGGLNYLVPFGSAGAGASVPVPGDYDGDGKTDVAVYLPAFGELAVHPSSGVANYLVPFGAAGAGNTIPAPGDYDGDGKTDVAAYLPTAGVFAYRPSSGGPDVLQPFGAAGAGATVPAAALPGAQPPAVAAAALGAGANSGVESYLLSLTDDLLPPTPAKKPRS